MELHLSPETEAKLTDLARRTHRDTGDLVGEAVDNLIEYNEWFERKVKRSLAEVEAGATIPDAEGAAWIEQRTRR